MKKTLLLGLLAIGGITANAQIANGTAAPDFTATDINGVQHNLYDYLDAGKTVILDISATWCGPCWGYHGTGALEDLYNSFGPNGSDEVVVLFVEGDSDTTGEDIAGTGPNTQGNWTNHSPYPIIDNGSISEIFNLEHFPTILRICPNGIMTEVGALAAPALKNSITAGCAVTLAGMPSHGEVVAVDQALCAAPETLTMQAKLRNFGNNAIAAATIVLKENGTVVSTKNYTGGMGQFGSANLTFTDVPFNAAAEYTVELVDINTVVQTESELTHKDMEVAVAGSTTNNIEVRVHTGYYPTEMSWKIRTAAGTLVAQGGPYAGSANGGGADANTVKTHYVTLPAGTDCYKVEMIDGYGDGWTFGNSQGIEVYSGDGTLVFEKMNPGNFGASLIMNGAFVANGTLGTPTIETAGFAIYPNPSTGVFNFTTQETVDVMIVDLTGKVVHTAKGIENNGSINLSALQRGMYIAKISGSNSERTEKIVIE